MENPYYAFLEVLWAQSNLPNIALCSLSSYFLNIPSLSTPTLFLSSHEVHTCITLKIEKQSKQPHSIVIVLSEYSMYNTCQACQLTVLILDTFADKDKWVCTFPQKLHVPWISTWEESLV